MSKGVQQLASYTCDGGMYRRRLWRESSQQQHRLQQQQQQQHQHQHQHQHQQEL